MQLSRLRLHSFRNFNELDFVPNQRLNLFIGENGSGKSSILESIYYLGFGRSFRTSRSNDAIAHHHTQFTVYAESASSKLKVGLERNTLSQFRCHVNSERKKSLSELVSLFPVQLFTPESTSLLTGSPKERRMFLDWGVFHVEHSSITLFRRAKHVLRQRNALLKSTRYKDEALSLKQLDLWDKQHVELSLNIHERRLKYITSLIPIFNQYLTRLAPEISVQIEYNCGWDAKVSLNEVMDRKRDLDTRHGNTSAGHHRADLKFKVGDNDANVVLSRGQLRICVAALMIAQARKFKDVSGTDTIFLLDDIGAELDPIKREAFLDCLMECHSQLFVTAIEKAQVEFIKNYNNKQVFHVKHGTLVEES